MRLFEFLEVLLTVFFSVGLTTVVLTTGLETIFIDGISS